MCNTLLYLRWHKSYFITPSSIVLEHLLTERFEHESISGLNPTELFRNYSFFMHLLFRGVWVLWYISFNCLTISVCVVLLLKLHDTVSASWLDNVLDMMITGNPHSFNVFSNNSLCDF